MTKLIGILITVIQPKCFDSSKMTQPILDFDNFAWVEL
jgi:hypothetical protein